MLILENLGYQVGSKALIRNVSIQLDPGMYGVIGPNGAGKSTLLKALSGVWKPTSGQVLWHGKNIALLARRAASRIISLVPQNPLITFDYTVLEMVAMGRYPHDSAALQQGCQHVLVEDALRMVDGWHLKDRAVTAISSGERQRVYIARSLATQSPVLVLDEPTNSLDVRHQRDIWQLLKELQPQGKIIIIASHDLEAIQRHTQRVILMDKGCCIAFGSHQQVMTEERMQNIFGI